MKQTVYVDVLLGTNLFINDFLLLSVSKFLLRPVKRWRCLLGAAAGALYALTILVSIPALLSFAGKIALSVAIIRIVFPWEGSRSFLKAVLSFYLASFAFAGIMLGIWFVAAPNGLIINNSIVYFNISPLIFLVLTVLCYVVLRVVQRVTGRQMPMELQCSVTVYLQGRTFPCLARIDTGNDLVEPFSGFPVLVVDESCIMEIPLPPPEQCRVIPFQAMSGEGLLQGFRPEKIEIMSKGKKVQRENLYIAVSKTPLSHGEYQALLNPMLLD